jgi:ankyrin repeat protein
MNPHDQKLLREQQSHWKTFRLLSAYVSGVLILLFSFGCATTSDSPVVTAVSRGKNKEITKLLASESDPYIKARALGIAATKENVEALILILDAGVAADAPDKEGKTALMCAAESGALESAKLLLKRGADVNRQMDARIVEVNVSSEPGRYFRSMLLKAKAEAGNTALSFAILNARELLVELLLEEGADVNKRVVYQDARQVKNLSTGKLHIVNEQESLIEDLARKSGNANIIALMQRAKESQIRQKGQ